MRRVHQPDAPETLDTAAPQAPSARPAVAALLLATVFWGCGFAWAKTAGETVNAACGFANGAPFGPMFVLTARFIASALLWFAMFPDSRRGWTRQDLLRTLILGVILSAGMIVQHLGLDRTSEAVSAFLTSLTILFVPLMMTFVLGKPPRPILWLGVVLATIGVWLMTGAAPSGFGIGELLGLSCALVYSVDIIVLNYLITPANVSRLTAGQFLVVGLSNLIACLFLPGGGAGLARGHELVLMPAVGSNVALLAIFPTLLSFGLQFRFQPRLDPSRAALIYLMEPIFASLFALMLNGRGLNGIAVMGAALIIVANLLVELVASRNPINTPIID
jgi:drug/metabolite transporter (DMT)-like permease